MYFVYQSTLKQKLIFACLKFRFFKREVETAINREERIRALNQIKAIETERLNTMRQENEKLRKVEEENRNMQIAIDLIEKMKSKMSPPQ